jgi:hypothetical protein
VTCGFFALAAALFANLWGRPRPLPKIPLVDPAFLETTPWRKAYADMVRDGDDLSDFSCYVCHNRKSPPPLRFDADQNVIVAQEHSDIVMAHGWNNRNNLCFNCHNEANLETLQARNGRELTFSESSQLCGSCHGPNYRDWEAGAHGRTSGYWNRALGPIHRLDCVNCHNPHAPAIPTRKPAPPPHPMRPEDAGEGGT